MTLIHMACLNVERNDEERFSAWYETRHLAAMLDRPGWRGARRYQCLDGEPRYVTIYDLDEAMENAPLSEAPYRSPEFERTGIRDYRARTYKQIHDAGEHPTPPTLVNIVTVDMNADHAESFSRWYNEIHVPEILACPGWRGNRRFECVDGEPRFLAIYDLDDAQSPFTSAAYHTAVGWDEHVEHIRGYHGFRIYRLIYDSYG
jgi:heme-degrading monooxygenase HmoA